MSSNITDSRPCDGRVGVTHGIYEQVVPCPSSVHLVDPCERVAGGRLGFDFNPDLFALISGEKY